MLTVDSLEKRFLSYKKSTKIQTFIILVKFTPNSWYRQDSDEILKMNEVGTQRHIEFIKFTFLLYMKYRRKIANSVTSNRFGFIMCFQVFITFPAIWSVQQVCNKNQTHLMFLLLIDVSGIVEVLIK